MAQCAAASEAGPASGGGAVYRECHNTATHIRMARIDEGRWLVRFRVCSAHAELWDDAGGVAPLVTFSAPGVTA